jgi:hypothetical protein
MRCPPGLIFDDLYQRCEWPGAGAQSPNQRLGRLRDKKSDNNKNSSKTEETKVKQLRLITTIKQLNTTSLSSTTVSPTNQNTTKLVEP